MKIIRIQEFNQFDSILLQTLQSAPGRVFVLLFGSEDPATGESWCSDCVIGNSLFNYGILCKYVADPRIRKAIMTVPNSTLLEVPVGPRSMYVYAVI